MRDGEGWRKWQGKKEESCRRDIGNMGRGRRDEERDQRVF